MFPNVESLSGSANGTYLGPVAIGRDDVFFTLGTEVWRYIKAAPMPMTTQVGTLPQVIGDLEVVGGDVFVSLQGKVMWRCSDMACAPLAADDVGSWNKLARIPNASNAPLFALHNPEATLYRLTTEGVPTATLHSVGANWAGYDVDALDEQNLAFTAWGAGGDPNTGVVYRSFMPAVGQQTWSPQAMHAGAIALRGDKTIFVMVGDAVSERVFEWGPGDGTAKLSPLDAKLGAVPVASPLKYNPETDVLYAVGVKDSGYTLAACRCGTCALSDVVCGTIGGIDVERDPCDPHHGAAYFTCDDTLIRWDYPAPQ